MSCALIFSVSVSLFWITVFFLFSTVHVQETAEEGPLPLPFCVLSRTEKSFPFFFTPISPQCLFFFSLLELSWKRIVQVASRTTILSSRYFFFPPNV